MSTYFKIAYRRSLITIPLFVLSLINLSANNSDSLIAILDTQQGEVRLNTLIELSTVYYSISGDEAVKYGLLAVHEASKFDNQNTLALALLKVRNGYNMLTMHDSSIIYAKKVLSLDDIDKKFQAKAYSAIAESHLHLGNIDESINKAMKSLAIFREIGDSTSIAKEFSAISNMYTNKGDYTMALDYGLKALEVFEKYNDSLRIALAKMRIGTMYMKKRDRPSAKPYYFSAFEIAKKFPNSMTYNNLLANIANYYRLTRNSDSALYFYNKSLEADRKLGRTQDIAGSYMNMGHLYLRNNDFEAGISNLKKALIGFKETGAVEHIGNVYASMGLANFFEGNYDTSLYYTNKALKIGLEKNSNRLIYSTKELLPGIYDKMGEHKKSLDYYKVFIAYKDSIDGVKVKGKLAELETKYETAKKDQQITELELQQEIEKSEKLNQRIIFLSVLILFLLLLAWVWQKRKKDRQIHQQKELYHKKDKQLAQLELEKSKLKEEELQQSILYKSKQLSTHALHMMQKNTMLQEIQTDIKSMSKKASVEDKPEYKRINLQINQSLRSDKDWDVFKLYFEDVNRNFFNSLQEINPNLTTNDHRLCALIKLNMNSKEMASVLNVAPNSIKSSRYRLKKKLKLNPEADLEEYIREL